MPNLMTAGPIPHLRKGWAKFPFLGRTVHHWAEDTETMPETIGEGGRVRYYTSACGLLAVTTPRTPAMYGGSWPKCKRCLRAQH